MAHGTTKNNQTDTMVQSFLLSPAITEPWTSAEMMKTKRMGPEFAGGRKMMILRAFRSKRALRDEPRNDVINKGSDLFTGCMYACTWIPPSVGECGAPEA